MSARVESSPLVAANVIVPLPSEATAYEFGPIVWVCSVFPRFRACPVTADSAKDPDPFAVSLKLAFRILPSPAFGNSRLEIQYAPLSVEVDTGCAGAGIAIKRSKTVAPASVDEPTSAPAPNRALIVVPDRIGF